MIDSKPSYVIFLSAKLLSLPLFYHHWAAFYELSGRLGVVAASGTNLRVWHIRPIIRFPPVFHPARYATTIYYTITYEIAGGPKRFAPLIMFGFNVLSKILMGINLFEC